MSLKPKNMSEDLIRTISSYENFNEMYLYFYKNKSYFYFLSFSKIHLRYFGRFHSGIYNKIERLIRHEK
jgi:hypothetical protein